MSNPITPSSTLIAEQTPPDLYQEAKKNSLRLVPDDTLPLTITKAASKQTYYTIRFLADRARVLDAFRAYAYFRWVDDWLDQQILPKSERLAFLERQHFLVKNCYQDQPLDNVTAEEQMIVELIRTDPAPDSGLHAYIQNMMRVMAFDAERQGCIVSQEELDEYSRYLAVAVTEALHYFIGHDNPTLQDNTRYLAVMGAHITHMLRDTYEDIAAGYFNISREFLDMYKLSAYEVTHDEYIVWVKSRVELARSYFAVGKCYIAHVENLRCRIAGYAYISRFENVLDSIERDGYRLRPEYPERKHLKAILSMIWFVLTHAFKRA